VALEEGAFCVNARLEPFTLKRKTETANAWKEKVPVWETVGAIRAAISTASGSLQTQNELLRIESTHTAVTWDEVRVGDRLERAGEAPFEVTYVIPGTRRRMAQLFLKAVEGP
jgi:hypothetical protein